MLPIFPFLLGKFEHLIKFGGLLKTAIHIYWALPQPYKASLIILILQVKELKFKEVKITQLRSNRI